VLKLKPPSPWPSDSPLAKRQDQLGCYRLALGAHRPVLVPSGGMHQGDFAYPGGPWPVAPRSWFPWCWWPSTRNWPCGWPLSLSPTSHQPAPAPGDLPKAMRAV
jgi:hypothetical protein